LIKFCENFSPGSSLNQFRIYQGNSCSVYPDLSFLSGSGVIQNNVICIKRSTPSKDHIIWYQSFSSCYRFYPIRFFFLFVICLRFVSCSVICVFVCVLLHSYLRLVAFLFPILLPCASNLIHPGT